MLNFDRSTVKHGTTQNIQNDCHQWLSDSFKSAPNSFMAGASPQTPLGELTALPSSWFKGPYFKRGGRGETERKGG